MTEPRRAKIERKTKESDIVVELDLDGTGVVDIDTGVPFYDHMLTSLGSHASFDLTVRAKGDVDIEGHHTIEDTAIVLGQALGQALGEKKGIRRFGDAWIPMDETLAHAAVDVSGRPYCVHTGEPEHLLHTTIAGSASPRGAVPHGDQPARLRVAGDERPHRTARAHAVRPRPAPHHRGAVQGRRPRAAAGRGVRPACHRRAIHQRHAVTAKVVVLDYGSGNLRSAQRALQRVGADVEVTSDMRAADAADGLVVPGVGAFEACMTGLRKISGDKIIAERVAAGRPVLGVCVGMQILFARGVEFGQQTTGCGQWPGAVVRLDAPVIPHMGWNVVDAPAGTTLFKGIGATTRFYFVHSYAAQQWEGNPDALLTWATHHVPFLAAVEDGPLAATQFHPEKSGDAGAALLTNWVGALG